jgi:hypothetical protein
MTIITLSIFAAVATMGIVATIAAMRLDGYRRVPTRRS